LHPQLTALNGQLDEASIRARNLVSSMLADDMRLRPDLNGWSVAECIEHLSMSSEAFINAISDASNRARERGVFGTGPYELNLVGRFLNWRMRPPVIIKARTPDKFQPDLIEPLEELLPRFLSWQERLKTETANADGLDLNRVIVQSPFSKHVRYSLFSCLVLIVTHEHRHLWQAENTRKAIVRVW